MAKADRLLKIITLLKGRRTVITARQLAEVLETSERTVYRDIQVLLDTGFPVEGKPVLVIGYSQDLKFLLSCLPKSSS